MIPPGASGEPASEESAGGGSVAELLVSCHDHVARYVNRRGGRLLSYESTDDLVQSIHARALEHGAGCAFPSRSAFLEWLYRVAASHLSDRRAHWAALRRDPCRLLRITRGIASDGRSVAEPVADATGPGTRADRDDAARRAEEALTLLLPRDRELVEWTIAGVPLEDQATRLGISYTAARQARHRALARLRSVFAVVGSRPAP